jgi:hypothetical protein
VSNTLTRSIVILAFLTSCQLLANPLVEVIKDGKAWINWNCHIVKAVGNAALPGDSEDLVKATEVAYSAAVIDAQRNLSLAVQALRVNNETYIRDFVSRSSEARCKLERLINSAQIVSEKQLGDRSFEVILQLPLTGEKGVIATFKQELFPKNDSKASSIQLGTISLIIDAIRLGIKPCIFPRIYTENGKEVYSINLVSPELAISKGIAMYWTDIQNAKKSLTANSKPLIVKALRKRPDSSTDIVIGNKDVALLRQVNEITNLSEQCNVSIIVRDISANSSKNSFNRGVSR